MVTLRKLICLLSIFSQERIKSGEEYYDLIEWFVCYYFCFYWGVLAFCTEMMMGIMEILFFFFFFSPGIAEKHSLFLKQNLGKLCLSIHDLCTKKKIALCLRNKALELSL